MCCKKLMQLLGLGGDGKEQEYQRVDTSAPGDAAPGPSAAAVGGGTTTDGGGGASDWGTEDEWDWDADGGDLEAARGTPAAPADDTDMTQSRAPVTHTVVGDVPQGNPIMSLPRPSQAHTAATPAVPVVVPPAVASPTNATVPAQAVLAAPPRVPSFRAATREAKPKPKPKPKPKAANLFAELGMQPKIQAAKRIDPRTAPRVHKIDVDMDADGFGDDWDEDLDLGLDDDASTPVAEVDDSAAVATASSGRRPRRQRPRKPRTAKKKVAPMSLGAVQLDE